MLGKGRDGLGAHASSMSGKRSVPPKHTPLNAAVTGLDRYTVEPGIRPGLFVMSVNSYDTHHASLLQAAGV